MRGVCGCEGQPGNFYDMAKSAEQKVESASQLIAARIKELGDWRGKTLSRVRALIRKAEPEVVEEWKWRKASNPGVPVWYRHGPICTGETYKSVVKLTFFKGASLEDPSACSTRASRATPGAQSTCARAMKSTSRRSRPSFELPSA